MATTSNDLKLVIDANTNTATLNGELLNYKEKWTQEPLYR